jgi:hypothetical protein
MLATLVLSFALTTPPGQGPDEASARPPQATSDPAAEQPGTEPEPERSEQPEQPEQPPSSIQAVTPELVTVCEGPNCDREWTGPTPRYWGGQSHGDHTNLRNAGLGLVVAGSGMAVGSILAGTLSVCGHDGTSGADCKKDTRVHLAIGFAAASALLAGTGGALMGIAKKKRKLELSISGDRRGANVSIGGRF